MTFPLLSKEDLERAITRYLKWLESSSEKLERIGSPSAKTLKTCRHYLMEYLSLEEGKNIVDLQP